MEDAVYHFQEFAFLYHLVCNPCTYIVLGEGEWVLDVQERLRRGMLGKGEWVLDVQERLCRGIQIFRSRCR